MYPKSDQQLSYEDDENVYFFSNAIDPLNNWSGHSVKIWGKTFPTLEHGYHYRKHSETNPALAARILAAPSAWAALQIEHEARKNRRSDWEEIKVDMMTELIRAKVAQNKDVRDCLLATGTKRIVENSPWNTFWGIGVDKTGKNMMGEILMRIRDELRSSAKA